MKAERKILSIRKITFVQSVSLYTDFKIKIYISTYISISINNKIVIKYIRKICIYLSTRRFFTFQKSLPL